MSEKQKRRATLIQHDIYNVQIKKKRSKAVAATPKTFFRPIYYVTLDFRL